MKDLIWKGVEVQKVRDKNGIVREYTVTRVQRVQPNKYSVRYNNILKRNEELAMAKKKRDEEMTTGQSGAVVLGAS